ncbi:secretory lipase, putative [Metarhizium acridum CQMa 102]|uniref:Secretory lipase, putative n=1 Tax=Metarhizium acridum (strain CQMa 102) TaxID=655827 RepID=E9EG97_METAQ|nr:secretory lipase, putative [Metarhizium acridum CQMa 102]EFY85049.1 secretory lipase, putative [Metarhizium acridum CQMa 102]
MLVARCFSLLATLAYVTAVPLAERAGLLPPSQDPWYQVPKNLDAIEPGSILKSRKPPAPIASFGIKSVNLKDAHQIMYKTTNSFNRSTATVTTVLIPHNADFNKVLSYQSIVDAAFIDCAPSYALQLGSKSGVAFGTFTTQAELFLIATLLDKGWVVVLPDYLGPHSAFLANKLAAHAVLDSIRAVTKSTAFTGVHQNATVALWGYSGGSVATGWAAELHASYAPELNIVGAALGGTVPSIPPVIKAVNRGYAAGLLPSGFLGLSGEYPELKNIIQERVLPQHRPAFEKVKKQCLVADLEEFPFEDVVSMLKDPSVLTSGALASIFNDIALGKSTPKMPLYVYKPVHDEISPVASTDELVKFYCANGGSVQYERDWVSLHGTLLTTGAAKALSWLISLVDGKPQPTGCSTSNVVSSLFDLKAVEIFPTAILDALLALVGRPIGPLL